LATFSGQYLSIESHPNGVAIVRLDDKNAKVNTLNAKMTDEFVTMLDTVEKDPQVKSVVLISSKV
jgi:enoyl-CoA hydratase/carnithine racemase